MTTEARPLATSNQTTSIRKHFSLVLNSSRSIDSACRLHQIVIRWRTAFSCVITQQVVVIPYRHFGTNCQSHFSPTFPEDGTDKLSPPSRRKPEITNIRVIKWPRIKWTEHVTRMDQKYAIQNLYGKKLRNPLERCRSRWKDNANKYLKKGKVIPLQAQCGPEGG